MTGLVEQRVPATTGLQSHHPFPTSLSRIPTKYYCLGWCLLPVVQRPVFQRPSAPASKIATALLQTVLGVRESSCEALPSHNNILINPGISLKKNAMCSKLGSIGTKADPSRLVPLHHNAMSQVSCLPGDHRCLSSRSRDPSTRTSKIVTTSLQTLPEVQKSSAEAPASRPSILTNPAFPSGRNVMRSTLGPIGTRTLVTIGFPSTR